MATGNARELTPARFFNLLDDVNDPESMTPQDRHDETAAILAAGFLRLHRGPDAPPFTEKPLDCFGTPLPLCAEGLTAGEPAPVEVSE